MCEAVRPDGEMAASAPLAVVIVPGLGGAGRGSVMVPSSPPVSAAPLLLSGLLDIARFCSRGAPSTSRSVGAAR